MEKETVAPVTDAELTRAADWIARNTKNGFVLGIDYQLAEKLMLNFLVEAARNGNNALMCAFTAGFVVGRLRGIEDAELEKLAK